MMFDSAMALVGALGGGLLRLVPELIKVYLHRTDDRTHVKLAEIQLELQQTRETLDAAASAAQAQRAEIVRRMAQRDADAAAAEITAPPAPLPAPQIALPRERGRWVEAAVTFWLLAIYTGFKAVLMWEASSQHVTAAVLAPLIWGDDDWTIFSGAITYWFIDRTLSTPDARNPSK